LHHELHNLYYTQDIIRVIKQRIGWVAHIACMDMRNTCNILVRKP